MNKALIGNGGHAREVMAQMNENLIRFVDDEFYDGKDQMVLPLSSFNPEEYEVMVAIGNSTDRMEVVNRLPINTKFFSFVHPDALIMFGDVVIGEGAFVGAFSIITTNVKIGKHALLNRGNHIGHDCKIGDYFSAMPGAIVSGRVNIGNGVYLGTNAVVIEELSVVDNCTIGASACVVENLDSSGVYVGVPAKIKL